MPGLQACFPTPTSSQCDLGKLPYLSKPSVSLVSRREIIFTSFKVIGITEIICVEFLE